MFFEREEEIKRRRCENEETNWIQICRRFNWNKASCCSGTDDIFHISSFSFVCSPSFSSSFLPPLFFLLYSLQVLSNFSDLLPLLLQFCCPWNQFLMATQWPRAGPTCCIQMCPPAIISPCPTLYKHSFNNLSSYESAHFRSWNVAKCSYIKPLLLLLQRPAARSNRAAAKCTLNSQTVLWFFQK